MQVALRIFVSTFIHFHPLSSNFISFTFTHFYPNVAVLIIYVTSDRIVLIQYQDQESKCVTIDQTEKAGIRICCPYAYNDDMHHN